MTDHNTSLVNLSIPREVTQPIVAAKIQEAVLAALGGADKIVEGIVFQICNKQVNLETGKESTSSYDKKVSWMDYHVTSIIQDAVKQELKNQLETGAVQVKEALIKTMQSKQGANKFADAILQSLTGAFKGENIIPKISIDFTVKSKNNW